MDGVGVTLKLRYKYYILRRIDVPLSMNVYRRNM